MDISALIIYIKPLSAFGTLLKGDTLFGQFCWQVAEDPSLAQKELTELLDSYEMHPFVVFSSAWPTFIEGNERYFALPRPELPLSIIGEPENISSCAERLRKRKENRARKWFIVSRGLNDSLSWDRLIDDNKLFEKVSVGLPREERQRLIIERKNRPIIYCEQQHNTINRLTSTTGTGMFAPYSMQNIWFMPRMELAIFVAFDSNLINISQIKAGLERIGDYGYGRDASTGLGRFVISDIEKVDWPMASEGQKVFTLGPCVPEKGRFNSMYFQPFTRFGRHGAQLLHTGRPFKNPVLMASEGAVFETKVGDRLSRPWIGTAIKGVSKALSETVVQGYSLVLPLNQD